MKKALLLLVISSLLLIITGCADVAKSDFNFTFKYGITARNILDTFHGTFTKDMISAPSITIDLPLSDKEMDSIYQKMVEIDFFNYPDEFKVNVTGDVIGTVTPYPSYYFYVEHPAGGKVLRWEDEITNPDVKADKLRELIVFIRGIIESRAEYQALPKPSGGYL